MYFPRQLATTAVSTCCAQRQLLGTPLISNTVTVKRQVVDGERQWRRPSAVAENTEVPFVTQQRRMGKG
jgi:hypothetical protein